MKQPKLKVFLFALLLMIKINSYGQDIKDLSLEFIDFNEARISVGLGFDLAVPTGLGGYQTVFNRNAEELGASFSLVLDLFAPNSVVSFYSQISYRLEDFSILDLDDNFKDRLENRSINIPLYLKLRSGSAEKKEHFMALLGGAVSKTLSSESLFSTATPMNNFIYFASGGIGLEYLWRYDPKNNTKTPRLMIMLMYQYPLTHSYTSAYADDVLWFVDNVPDNIKLGHLLLGVDWFF